MQSKPGRVTAARAVTVAGVAGGALAVGLAAYQPPAARLAADRAKSATADQVIPFERAPWRSRARSARSGLSD